MGSMQENYGNLSQLKSVGYQIAVTRLMLKAARLQALLGKANFNPNQPRVPRGSPHGGEWTRVGPGADASGTPRIIRVSGGEDPPDIPRKRPPTTRERNTIVKRLARWAARRGLRRIPVLGDAIWIYEFAERLAAYLEPPRTLEELQRGVPRWKIGTDVHHIVERTSALEDGFSAAMIEAPENKVRISRLGHRLIKSHPNSC